MMIVEGRRVEERDIPQRDPRGAPFARNDDFFFALMFVAGAVLCLREALKMQENSRKFLIESPRPFET
jgi:hypothetical protein